LMNKAAPWDIMVTESVCTATMQAPSADSFSFDDTLEGQAGRRALIQSPPTLTFLKGKGLHPVRRICLRRKHAEAVHEAHMDYLKDTVGKLSHCKSLREKLHLAVREGAQAMQGQDLDTYAATVSAILYHPWNVIRARFDPAIPSAPPPPHPTLSI
ncbi:hypothetical protein KIPB_011804, partial [Kipferlia bialata]